MRRLLTRKLNVLAAVLLIPPATLLQSGDVPGHILSAKAATPARVSVCGSGTISANRPRGTWHTDALGYPRYRFTAAPLRRGMVSRRRAIKCGLRMTSSPMQIRSWWRVSARFGRYTDAHFLPRWSWVVTFTGAGVVPKAPKGGQGGPGSRVTAVVDGRTGTVYGSWGIPN